MISSFPIFSLKDYYTILYIYNDEGMHKTFFLWKIFLFLVCKSDGNVQLDHYITMDFDISTGYMSSVLFHGLTYIAEAFDFLRRLFELTGGAIFRFPRKRKIVTQLD